MAGQSKPSDDSRGEESRARIMLPDTPATFAFFDYLWAAVCRRAAVHAAASEEPVVDGTGGPTA